MKFYTLTSLIIIALFTISCNNASNHTHDEAIAIELENGQKWKVNSEMSPFILEGQKLLNEYNNDDYITLAKQLKEKNNSLIKSCTMGGKSHDELHKWLHPHIELVDALGKADTKQNADELIMKLKKSFEVYNQHFQ